MTTTFPKLLSQPFLPIVTERLLMRPMRLDDAPRVASLLNNFNVSKTTAFIPYPYSLDDATSFIAQKIQEMEKKGQLVLVLSILDRTTSSDQLLLGCIAVENNSIGYWLGEPYWGKGLMKEASRAFVHFLFHDCEISELEIHAMPDNLGSIRIIEGLGSVRTFQKEVFSVALQDTRNCQFYKLTRDDYWVKYEASSVPIVWVSAAALFKDEKLLVVERPQGKSMAGVWELPSVKMMDLKVTPEKVLERALQEMLDITVDPHMLKPFTFVSYQYESIHLVMPIFTLTAWEGDVHDKEGHGRLVWVHYRDLIDYPTPSANRAFFHRLYHEVQQKGLWA